MWSKWRFLCFCPQKGATADGWDLRSKFDHFADVGETTVNVDVAIYRVRVLQAVRVWSYGFTGAKIRSGVKL
jgi:hypothetical protein